MTEAEHNLASGRHLAIWDRDVGLLAGLDATQVMTEAVDICDLAAVQRATAQVVARWGRIDVLVN